MTATLRRQALALSVVTTHKPLCTASIEHVLRNPLNGSGGTTVGARIAANNRRKVDRTIGKLLVGRLNRAAVSELDVNLLDPIVVLLTRVSPKPFDSDNLSAAFKSIRDGMADFWGVNDGSETVTWVYDWRKGREHSIEASLWFLVTTEAAS